ncbi:hypothetical protein F5B20DRAFT_534250 [Whalleya microplaca]|nr:hypothetical protein F5B20DRAFT_534250 [Whalleya microplaca]
MSGRQSAGWLAGWLVGWSTATRLDTTRHGRCGGVAKRVMPMWLVGRVSEWPPGLRELSSNLVLCVCACVRLRARLFTKRLLGSAASLCNSLAWTVYLGRSWSYQT